MKFINTTKVFWCICTLVVLISAPAIYADAAELNSSVGQLLHSEFAHLIAGENYIFLVVKDKEAADLLDEENLLYIGQQKADASGQASFSYRFAELGSAVTILQGKISAQTRELTWSLSEEGTLTLYGQGDMDSFEGGQAPWYSRKEDIQIVRINRGITGIGSYAFEGCTNLKEIYFGGDVPVFHENCFHSVKADAYYPKDDPIWMDAVLENCGGQIAWIPYEQRDPVFEGTEHYVKTYGDNAFDLDTVLTEGNGVLSYTSSNSAVAEVSKSGRVTITGAGTAEITVSASETAIYNRADFIITITVKKTTQVIEGAALYEKQLDAEPFVLDVACKTGFGKLQYQSARTSVAAVSESGLVTIAGIGRTKITVLAGETDNYLPQEYAVDVVVTVSDALQAAYDKARAEYDSLQAHKDKYTQTSWNAYEKALNEVEKIIKTEGTTQEQLQKALAAIDEAKPTERLAQVKEDLNSAIERMNQLSEEDYTEVSWKQMKEVLTEARNLLASDTATVEQLEAVLEKVQDIQMVTKEEYTKQITEARNNLSNLLTEKQTELQRLKPSDYTPESWAALQNAINEAEELLKKENVTAEELQEVGRKLKEAAQKLTKSENNKNPEFGTGTNSGTDTGTGTNPGNNNPGTGSNPGNSYDKSVQIKKITIKPANYSIAAGRKITLNLQISPVNASNKSLTWMTSNKKYATVKNGIVTTKKAGIGKKVTISAVSKDKSGIRTKVTIKIMKHAVRKIRLKVKTKTVKAGKKVTIQASIQTTGKKANKKLEWTSSNTTYATVNSKGVVKTKKAGSGKTVRITAISTDGTNKSAAVRIKIR